jgi:hypothetical protein
MNCNHKKKEKYAWWQHIFVRSHFRRRNDYLAMVLIHSVVPVRFLTFSHCMRADVLDLYTYDILGNGLTTPQSYFTSEPGVEKTTGLRCICLAVELLAVFSMILDQDDMHLLQMFRDWSRGLSIPQETQHKGRSVGKYQVTLLFHLQLKSWLIQHITDP